MGLQGAKRRVLALQNADLTRQLQAASRLDWNGIAEPRNLKKGWTPLENTDDIQIRPRIPCNLHRLGIVFIQVVFRGKNIPRLAQNGSLSIPNASFTHSKQNT